jgi:Asp-tRNA(Asn)/Glu-tRNA(Gln) amidotransferase A subunit family amidase
LEVRAKVAKKWYNFFVVADQAKADADAFTEAVSAQRVADVVPGADQDTAFAGSVGGTASLEELYASAKIATPPHGYSILKVADMLESEHIRSLPPDVKRKSILVALDAAGVKVQEIVEDAVQRDRALDTYERVLEKNLEDLRRSKEQENQRLEEEINQRLSELRARIAENNREVSRQQENLSAWRTGKRAEEERIAQAVGYFVSGNPIPAGQGNRGGAEHVR